MNKHQRRFFNELADLMQKYSVRMDVQSSWGDFDGIYWDFGSTKGLEHFHSLNPSIIRRMIEESNEQTTKDY